MNGPVQVLIISPKRLFKSAVARNKVKRTLRECYRLQKLPLNAYLTDQSIQLHVAVIYTKNELQSFDVVLNAIEKGLSAVIKRLSPPAI